MKKLLPLILSAALVFSSCAAAADETPLATPTPEPQATPTATPVPTGDFYTLRSAWNLPALNTGDAYYSFTQKPGYILLLKTDYATATQSVYCTVPGCTHDSDNCPAYFPGQDRRYDLVSDGNTIYVYHISWFYQEKSWDEYYEEIKDELTKTELYHATEDELLAGYRGRWAEQTTPPRLYTVTPGSKTYVDLPMECRDYAMAYSDGNSLYGYGSDSYGTHGMATPVCRVELATGAVDTFTLLPEEEIVAPYDGALLTRHWVTDAPLPTDDEQYNAAIQSATAEFDRYDPRTGARSKVAERPYSLCDYWDDSGCLGVYNDKLYFEDRTPTSDGGYLRMALNEYDPATGTTTQVWDTCPPSGLRPVSVKLPLHGDGTARYIWMDGSDGSIGDNSCAVLDTATLSVTPVTQYIDNDPSNFNALPMAQTNDGRWLLWTKSDGSSVPTGYGLIDPAEFITGSTAWTDVEMWEG